MKPSRRVKDLWRRERQSGRAIGESLKSWSRRQTDETAPVQVAIVAQAWLHNKRSRAGRYTLDPHGVGLGIIQEIK